MPAIQLHDANVRAEIERRLRGLTPVTKGRWGRMTVDQMLWHCNELLAFVVGEREMPVVPRPPIPRALLKFVVLNLPWAKGLPTVAAFKALARHDFEAESTRCLRLVAKLAARDANGVWMQHPMFGPMTGTDFSRLQAKHLDHHLKQFGV